TSGPTGGVTNTPANPGSILEFTYTGSPGPITRVGGATAEPNSTPIFIYPNPVNNLLTINSNGNAVKSCELISVSGQLVKRINVTSSTTYISLSKENPGVYILKLYGNHDEVMEVKKLTIMH